MKKVAKKIDISKHKNFKVHFGTMDRIKSNSLYISMSSWANPKVQTTLDYEKVLRRLNKKIKENIYSNLDKDLFNDKFIIVDLDLRISGIKYNKRSFMNCDITLYKKTSDSIEDIVISDEINKLITSTINNVFDKSEYFSFHKTKK